MRTVRSEISCQPSENDPEEFRVASSGSEIQITQPKGGL